MHNANDKLVPFAAFYHATPSQLNRNKQIDEIPDRCDGRCLRLQPVHRSVNSHQRLILPVPFGSTGKFTTDEAKASCMASYHLQIFTALSIAILFELSRTQLNHWPVSFAPSRSLTCYSNKPIQHIATAQDDSSTDTVIIILTEVQTTNICNMPSSLVTKLPTIYSKKAALGIVHLFEPLITRLPLAPVTICPHAGGSGLWPIGKRLVQITATEEQRRQPT